MLKKRKQAEKLSKRKSFGLTGIRAVKMIDARKALSFTIRRSDYDFACMLDPTKCVLARAIQRSLKKKELEVQVGIAIVWVRDKNTVVRYLTTSDLVTARKLFDTTGIWMLAPGQYELLPVPYSKRLSSIKRTNRKVRKNLGIRICYCGRSFKYRKDIISSTLKTECQRCSQKSQRKHVFRRTLDRRFSKSLKES